MESLHKRISGLFQLAKKPTVKIVQAPEPLFRLQCQLGEGPVWDAQAKRLYFVDIERNRVFTYEPSSNTLGYETFEDTVTCLAARKRGPGLVGTTRDRFIFLSPAELPFPPTSSDTPRPFRNFITAPAPVNGVLRHNDGACDPNGNFLAGTMSADSSPTGSVYLVRALSDKGSIEKVVKKRIMLTTTQIEKNVIISNGTGWSPDGKTMYYNDTGVQTMYKYAYDPSGPSLGARSVFYKPTKGAPDGLCMDNQGGIWCAHYGGACVKRINPSGKVDLELRFAKSLNITCCVFGGENLDILYVTTAHASGQGNDSQSKWPESGDFFAVPNLGYTGVERGRFDG